MLDFRIIKEEKQTQNQIDAEARNQAARKRYGFNNKPDIRKSRTRTRNRSSQPSNETQAEATNNAVIKAIEESKTPLSNIEICKKSGYSAGGLVACKNRLVKAGRILKLVMVCKKPITFAFAIPGRDFDKSKFEVFKD